MPRDFQGAFNAGELTPALHARVDLAKYHTGLATCLNWFVLAQGGVTVRPGMKFIGELADSASKQRLIPFQFNTEQTYALLLSHQKVRFLRDGGAVLETSASISGITQADPASVNHVGHGYATGETVYISGVSGMVQINDRFFRITVVDADNYTLDGIDSTGYDAYSSSGTAARVYEVTTPYHEDDLFRIKYTQSADVMTLTHPDYQQRSLARMSDTNWNLDTLDFTIDVDPPVNITVGVRGTATGSDDKNYRYVVTSVDESGTESLPSDPVESGQIDALSSTYGTVVSWDPPTGINVSYYNVYKEFSLNSYVFGWIGEADSEGILEFSDFNFGPDMSVTPPRAKDPFDSAGNYPGCTTYHQQRQYFGGTKNNPTTVWATRTADLDNMSISRPLRADDSIEATIASRQVNEVRHILSLNDLILFTSGGEWLVTADADGVVTPFNINFRPQGYRGSSHIEPLVIGDTALFIQEKGSRVRDLNYRFENDQYSGNDLTVLSEHLFYSHTIVDWDYAQEPFGIVWAVREDGVLLSLVYLKEHSVWAWSRHTTDGFVESVCSLSEGTEDVVYVVVRREVDGDTVRYVEQIQSPNIGPSAFYVDAGLTFEGTSYDISGATQADPVVITANGHGFSDGDSIRISGVEGMTELNGRIFEVSNSTTNTFELSGIDGTEYAEYDKGGQATTTASVISNLWHIEGKDVDVLADGNVVSGLTVSDGQITMQEPAATVHVGLPYQKDIMTLPLDFDGAPVQARRKAVNSIDIRTRDTRGLSVGKDENSLFEAKERTPAMNYDNVTAFTGYREYRITPGWNTNGQILIRQGYPLPATILAVLPEVVLRE